MHRRSAGTKQQNGAGDGSESYAGKEQESVSSAPDSREHAVNAVGTEAFVNHDRRTGGAFYNEACLVRSDLADIPNKAVSLARNRDDVLMVLRGFTQGLAQYKDILAEIGLFHEAVRPESLHQVFFGNDLRLVLHQNKESIERL